MRMQLPYGLEWIVVERIVAFLTVARGSGLGKHEWYTGGRGQQYYLTESRHPVTYSMKSLITYISILEKRIQ